MTLMLNECIYQNMYRYRYTVVVDLDEIIVPVNSSTYNEVYTQLNVHTSLTVRTSAFYLTYPAQLTSGTDLTSLRHFLRSDDHRVKVVLNPRHCVAMTSHRCEIPVRNRKRSLYRKHRLEVHHYRKTCVKPEALEKYNVTSCSEKKRTATVNDRMLHFKDNITSRFRQTKHQIFH